MTNQETQIAIEVDEEAPSSSSKPVEFFGGIPGIVGIRLISLFELAVAFVGSCLVWIIHDDQNNGAWIAISMIALVIPFFEAMLGIYVLVTAMMKKNYKKSISILYRVSVLGSCAWFIWIWIGILWTSTRHLPRLGSKASSQTQEIDTMQLILMLVYQALHAYFNVFIGKMKDSA